MDNWAGGPAVGPAAVGDTRTHPDLIIINNYSDLFSQISSLHPEFCCLMLEISHLLFKVSAHPAKAHFQEMGGRLLHIILSILYRQEEML